MADPRIRRVVDYIHSSLGDEISLDALAAVAGLSPSYFLGAFKQAMGRTPHRYLTEQRIARACERLQDPHRSITEVAFYVGFSSQSHLTSVFRRYTKTTPAAYRDEVLGLRRTAEDPMILDLSEMGATRLAATLSILTILGSMGTMGSEKVSRFR